MIQQHLLVCSRFQNDNFRKMNIDSSGLYYSKRRRKNLNLYSRWDVLDIHSKDTLENLQMHSSMDCFQTMYKSCLLLKPLFPSRLELQTFEMLIKGSTQTTRFPEQLLGSFVACQSKTHGDACQCYWRAWAISWSEIKVNLSPTSSNAFERSSQTTNAGPRDHDLINEILFDKHVLRT